MPKKKSSKHRGPGGWPRSHAPAPPAPAKPTRTPDERDDTAQLEKLSRGMAAVSRIDLLLQARALSQDEFKARMERLRELFCTNEELARLRPNLAKVEAAAEQWAHANRGPEAQEDADFDRRALNHGIAQAFDDTLRKRIQDGLTEALWEAGSDADADALVIGLLCFRRDVPDDPAIENPLFSMLAHLAMAETTHTEEVLENLGLVPSPDEIERLREEPDSLEALRSIFREKEGAISETLETDPVLRRHARRVADAADEQFYADIASGEFEPHLTAEELMPLAQAIGRLVKGFPSDADAGGVGQEHMKKLAKTLARFADAPASRPAYERFDNELRNLAERPAGPGPKATGTRLMARMWAGRWQDDSYFRMRVAHASFERLIKELDPGEE